jgi:hypothetical protein
MEICKNKKIRLLMDSEGRDTCLGTVSRVDTAGLIK